MTDYLPDVPLVNYIRRATAGGVRIATARDTIPALRSNHSLMLADWYRLEALKILLDISFTPHKYSVQARILYGRWLVDCHACNGANDVIPDEPVYLCSSCGWPENFAPVEFPVNRAEIERLLLKRPIHLRNWLPGETTEQLAAENMLLGCEV